VTAIKTYNGWDPGTNVNNYSTASTTNMLYTSTGGRESDCKRSLEAWASVNIVNNVNIVNTRRGTEAWKQCMYSLPLPAAHILYCRLGIGSCLMKRSQIRQVGLQENVLCLLKRRGCVICCSNALVIVYDRLPLRHNLRDKTSTTSVSHCVLPPRHR
jgi:hypothetical protein